MAEGESRQSKLSLALKDKMPCYNPKRQERHGPAVPCHGAWCMGSAEPQGHAGMLKHRQ